MLGRVLLVQPDRDNWSHPNVRNEVAWLIENAHWFKVYDIAEGLYAKLARAWDHAPAEEFQRRLNDFLVEHGIGWELRDGAITHRGSEAFAKSTHETTELLDGSGLRRAANEMREALRDISRRPDAATSPAPSSMQWRLSKRPLARSLACPMRHLGNSSPDSACPLPLTGPSTNYGATPRTVPATSASIKPSITPRRNCSSPSPVRSARFLPSAATDRITITTPEAAPRAIRPLAPQSWFTADNSPVAPQSIGAPMPSVGTCGQHSLTQILPLAIELP